MITYKEFLKQENEEDDRTNNEIGLILHYQNSILSVKTEENIWTIPTDRMKVLESKENAIGRLFRQIFDIDIDRSKFSKAGVKFNSYRGKLYLYTYKCRSNYRTNGYVSENYTDSSWVNEDKLPRPFCKELIGYIV